MIGRLLAMALGALLSGVSLARAWTEPVHSQFAAAVLNSTCCGISSLFAQTGMSASTVVASAGACDIWTPGEKEIFPGFYSMNTLAEFESNFLSIAKAGRYQTSSMIHPGYYRDSRTGRKYDPQPTPPRYGAQSTWTTDQQMFAEWYDPPDDVYTGAQLLGVLLHKIADAAVPSGHTPARDVCNNQYCEAVFEAMAAQAAASGALVLANYCRSYAVGIESVENPTEEQWSAYFDQFERNIQTYAVALCDGTCGYCGLTPNPSRVTFAQQCIAEAFKLANFVVPLYLRNTKEYLEAQPTIIAEASGQVEMEDNQAQLGVIDERKFGY